MWLFGDSFDHYATADINKKWNRKGNAPTIGATGRNGTSGLTTTGSSTFVEKTLDTPAPTGATIIVGVAYKASAFAAESGILQVVSAGLPILSLNQVTDGTLRLRRGTYNGTILGTTVRALNSGVWAYLELKVLIDGAAGTAALRVNGEDWAPFPLAGQDTGTDGYNGIHLGGNSSGASHTAVYDDLYVLDGTDSGIAGNPLNDFLGDTRGEVLLPNGNGATSGFTGNDGNEVDNYALVNEATPNDDTSFVAAQAVDAKDTYPFSDARTIGSIRCVQHLLCMKKSDTATKTVKSVVRDGGGTDRDSTATQNPAQVTYDYYRFNYPSDPASPLTGPWLKDNLNACEFGQKITQ